MFLVYALKYALKPHSRVFSVFKLTVIFFWIIYEGLSQEFLNLQRIQDIDICCILLILVENLTYQNKFCFSSILQQAFHNINTNNFTSHHNLFSVIVMHLNKTGETLIPFQEIELPSPDIRHDAIYFSRQTDKQSKQQTSLFAKKYTIMSFRKTARSESTWISRWLQIL